MTEERLAWCPVCYRITFHVLADREWVCEAHIHADASR